MREDVIKLGALVPGLPHPLLCPEKNEGWQTIRNGFDKAKKEIEESDADLLIIYSTYWPSVLGHQIQAMPEPVWTHVDEEFHELGSMEYKFRIDAAFAECAKEKCEERGSIHVQ